MFFRRNKYISLLSLVAMIFVACEKEAINTPSIGEFAVTSDVASYYVSSNPNTVYKIPVGITTISDKPRTLTYTVSSPTGAKEGEQYTILNSNTVVIPAGQSVDSIQVKGIFAGYPIGRRDTLVFQITGGDAELSPNLTNTFKLVLQKYCDVNLNDYLGEYKNTKNSATGASYTTKVTAVESTGPTTGYIIIEGLYNGVSTPVRVNLDWTDPANFTTTVVQTAGIYNDATYGAVSVRPIGTSSFSSCGNTFTLSYQRFVSAGNFAANTTTMAR